MEEFKKKLLFSGVAILFSLIMTTTAAAGNFVLMLKSGCMRLADETQNHDSRPLTFDDQSNKTFAVGWEIRNERNVGMGMEFLSFEHDFTSTVAPTTGGYSKSEIYMFTARKYFSPSKSIQPFVGIGLGWGLAKYDNGVNDVDRYWNPTLQLSGGVEFKFSDEFGLFLEAKGIASNTDGERENEIDYSGSGLMAGISFIF